MELTAEVAEEVFSDVADVVSNLDQEGDQTEENLGLIAGVFDQIDDLIEEEDFNVTDDVST